MSNNNGFVNPAGAPLTIDDMIGQAQQPHEVGSPALHIIAGVVFGVLAAVLVGLGIVGYLVLR